MGLVHDLLRKLHALVLLPLFQLLRRVSRFIFPDLFDGIHDASSDDPHDTDRSPLVPSRSSQLPDEPSTPLVSPPVIPSNSGQLSTAFDLPMPSVQDMPTPDGPLAPTSTRSYQAHGANSGSTHSGSRVAVQHINAADLSNETELAQIQHAPTESGESLFGDRSIAGPLSDEESEKTKTQSSEALGRVLGGYRSIGSDLTNLDENSRREAVGASSILYMRHGERQDMADSNWVNTAPRPWDPPLSSFGLKQASQRGSELLDSGTNITAVVASPFTRCIQTAVEVMKAYGLPPSALTIDARVCEWMSARNLNLSVVQERLGTSLSGEVQTWFWGTAGETGLKQVLSNSWSPENASKVHVGQMTFPRVHETLASARSRFQNSLLVLQTEFTGAVLVVTHGDALGAVIEQVKPLATVYQVETTGYVQFDKSPDAPKSFAINGAVGVQWLS